MTSPKRSAGQTQVSLSIEETLLAQIDTRAAALGLNRSSYLANLARQDLSVRGPFVLHESTTTEPPSDKAPAPVTYKPKRRSRSKSRFVEVDDPSPQKPPHAGG